MGRLEDTDPYPWPYDDDLRGQSVALVVAGAQPHWVSRSTGTNTVRANISAIAGAVRAIGGRVVLIRHGRTRLAPAGRNGRLSVPVESSPEWQLDGPIDEQSLVVDAAGLDGFFGSALDLALRNDSRSQLVLAGFAAEVCVDSTLRSANDQGYECLLVADACAPLDPDIGARALNSVTMSGGIFGAVGSTASLCTELARAPAAPAEPVPSPVPTESPGGFP